MVPEGYEFEPYECVLPALGGTKPYYWTKLSGQFPYGCSFQGDSIGIVSGTPNWATTYSVTFELHDSEDPPNYDTAKVIFMINPARPICGDSNSDRIVGISDVVYLINYIFTSGPAPEAVDQSDVNCDGKISIVDVVYLINYVFNDGATPCSNCP